MVTARVMTWNVWWRFGARWRERERLLENTMRAVDPDVVALQEVWADGTTTQADVLGGRLGRYAAFAEPSLPPPPEPPDDPDHAGVSLGLGLLSRWPIADTHTMAMSSAREPAPVVLVAQLAHPDGPLIVVAACLEYESRMWDDTLGQVQLLADLARHPSLVGDAPVVVAGDLNAPPSALQPLRDAGLADAWLLGGGDPHAVTLSSDHPDAASDFHLIDERIDHVFVGPGPHGPPVSVDRAVCAGDSSVNGLHPSDHWAVVCDVTWGGSAKIGR